jgi:predicted alpha/beta superfamily hydrolase
MKLLTFIFLLTISSLCLSQTTLVEPFESHILDEVRTLRIQLPKSFDTQKEKTYNLILTLDGEYLFYATIGNTELLSMEDLDIIPEVIVVGIDQNSIAEDGEGLRWSDCDYDFKNGLLEKKGKDFFNFINNELIPYLETTYRVNEFKTIIGHSLTANYINYFLTDTINNFNGYIAISPYVPKAFRNQLLTDIEKLSTLKLYSLSTGGNDLKGHRDVILELDSAITSTINNPNFIYSMHDYQEEDHTSLVNRSLPDGLKKVYSLYSPMGESELEKIMLSSMNPTEYLKNKYNRIKEIYELEIPIRMNDLFFTSFVFESQKNWDELKKIGELTVDLYPNIVYGYYMLGTANENLGNLKKALDHYELGYSKLTDDVTNKAQFYEDIERVKVEIGKEK